MPLIHVMRFRRMKCLAGEQDKRISMRGGGAVVFCFVCEVRREYACTYGGGSEAGYVMFALGSLIDR